MPTEQRFPPDISYGSTGGAIFSTTITTNKAGYEKRHQQWQAARCSYNVAHGVKSKAQLDELIAFFRAHKGRTYPFRFKDWSDYEGINQPLGIGDGTRTVFQLQKTYISGDYSDVRIIHKPVSGSVVLYKDAVLQSSGVTVDYNTGEVTFSSAPASGVQVSADFEFDVWVRFETDQLSAQLDDYGVYSWNEIPLVEVRVSL
jgi:uncharacterized protein (TIGR02217 family)